MNQLTEEQRERIEQIRRRNKCGDYDLDTDFLLSLLDNQAADGVSVSTLIGYEAGRSDGESEMRDACVEKVIALAEDYSDAWARQALKDAAREINSLTLDQVQEKR